MEKDLIKFYKNLSKEMKGIAKYEDEKGNLTYMNVGQLICGVEYLELDETEFKTAKFEQLIDTSLEYEETTKTKLIDKSTKTNNKKDKGTIIEEKVQAKKIWLVKNSMGVTKSFNEKDKALETARKINKQMLEWNND